MSLVTAPPHRNLIMFEHIPKLLSLSPEAAPQEPPAFQGKCRTGGFMSVFQRAVSLRKPYDGGHEATERPQFFTENHEGALLALAGHAEAGGRVAARAGSCFSVQHRGHGARTANTRRANMPYRLQAAHRRKEATKKCVCCLKKQQIFVFQNVWGKTRPSRMRNSIYFICVPEAWMTPKFGWWLNTRQNKPKPQILTGSTGWIAVNTISVQWSPWEVLPWHSGRLGQDPSSWATTCLGTPALEEKPFIGFGLFVGFFFGCAGLCTQGLWQQPYSSSSSRNYHGIILVSNRFNANYFFHLCSRKGLPWLLLEQPNHSTTNPQWGEERLQHYPSGTNSVTS